MEQRVKMMPKYTILISLQGPSTQDPREKSCGISNAMLLV
jgi:hypothetical protein